MDPATILKVATTVGKLSTSEEGRKILLIVILIPIILLLIIVSSPFVIFHSVTEINGEEKSIQAIMECFNEEFENQILKEEKDSRMDTVTTIVVDSGDNTLIDNSSQVLSFFSVQNSMRDKNNSLSLDHDQVNKLKEVFFEMNTMKSSIDEVIKWDKNNDKKVITRHKTIEIKQLTANEMAEKYAFSKEEKGVLKVMMDHSEQLIKEREQ